MNYGDSMKLDNNDINKYKNELTNDVELLDSFFNGIVDTYSGDLDKLMKEIHDEIIDIDSVPIYTIEKYFIKLSSEVYFMCANIEKLGLFDSLSKSKAQETYNMKYLEYQHKNDGIPGTKKPTVAEITAQAETASLYDSTLSDVYTRAYKTIKNKISAAETMISTLSKILSHRMQESQLTTQQTERQILNESQIF